MQKKVFRYAAMGFFVTTCMLSCIDNDYDLSKDISLDVSLGNKALFFPIGNTEELKLSDIIEIETDGTIQIEENGQYYLTKSGTINPVDFSVNPVKIDIEDVLFNIDPINFDTPSNIPATAPDMTVMISEEISKEAKLEIKEYINKDIISLKKIFVDANSSTKMSFEFSITGLPSSVKKVAFEDIYIELPDFILFKDENIINGKLTFNKDQDYIDLTNGNNKFTKVIEINGVDFTKLEGEYENGYNLAEKNNILEIDADVWIKGVFSAEVSMSQAALLKNIKINPSVTVQTLNIANVEGHINPDIDPLFQTIDLELGEDLDFLKNDAQLDLYNPQIFLNVKSKIGIPMLVNTTIDGRTIDKPENDSKIEIENIRLSKSDDGSLLNNYIIISKQGVTDEFAGFYCIPALSDMFKSIPDEVDINMKLRTDLSEIHIININETYEIETDYDVYVPLVFEELHINYEEIIEDLQKDLGDISEYVTDMNVSVEMTIQNTIPCELTLKSEAQDINGKKLNIEVKFWDKDKSDTEAIIPADGSKDLVLKLVAKDGELENLDKIILTINGNIAKSQTGKALNAEQFIKMDKMVLVVDGIEMNFND